MAIELMEHQKVAVDLLDSGKILYGGVGSGKSATVLAYYVKNEQPKDIIVITTAKKRDSLDWHKEAAAIGVGEARIGPNSATLTVDSWNNISKYTEIRGAFFIFDEQRVVGYGSWVKSFITIARKNRWVLLSATPGDSWMDYAPVFIANGYYQNITDFKRKHVQYAPFIKYPKIIGYENEFKLEYLRNEVLVEMPYLSENIRHINWIPVGYNQHLFDRVWRDRWHVYEDRPIKDVAELGRVMRKVVNSDPSRLEMVKLLIRTHMKLIVFYNFDYELEILRTLNNDSHFVIEWNGHRKDPIPPKNVTKTWVYLVQYVSGAESWNCIDTNAMCLYSLTYSYKNFEQCQGRIDRMNAPIRDLYYYILMSNSRPCLAIKQSLERKEDFNERKYLEMEAQMSDLSGGIWEFNQRRRELCET